MLPAAVHTISVLHSVVIGAPQCSDGQHGSPLALQQGTPVMGGTYTSVEPASVEPASVEPASEANEHPDPNCHPPPSASHARSAVHSGVIGWPQYVERQQGSLLALQHGNGEPLDPPGDPGPPHAAAKTVPPATTMSRHRRSQTMGESNSKHRAT